MASASASLRRLLPAVVAGLAFAAPAAVASDPVALAGRTTAVVPDDLAFDVTGRAVAAWHYGIRGLDEQDLFAVTDRAGTWRPAMTLARRVVWEQALAVSGRRVAIATWRQRAVGANRSSSRIVVTLVSAASSAVRRVMVLDSGPTRALDDDGPRPTLFSPRVAAAPNGGLVVAWLRLFPRDRAGIWVSTMRPDGRFTRPRRLGRAAGAPAIAVGADGRGLIAWLRPDNRIVVRVRHASGSWGRVERVARTTFNAALDPLRVAVGDGRYGVGFVHTGHSPAGVRIRSTAFARAGRGAWRSAVLGDFRFVATAETGYVIDRPQVLPVVASDGRMHVTWPASVGGHVRTMAATLRLTPSALTVTAPAAVSPATAHGVPVDIGAGRDGAFAVSWFDGAPGVSEIDAAGAVRMTTALATEPAGRAQLAYHPTSGRPLALWAQGDVTRGFQPVAWTVPGP